MIEVAVIAEIWAPCQRVWQDIAGFDRWYVWHRGMPLYKTRGSGVGACRLVSAYDGDPVTERLEAIDEQEHRLTYTTLAAAPAQVHCISTLSVRAIARQCCELQWRGHFATGSGVQPPVLDFLYQFYRGGIEGLKCRHEFDWARPSTGLNLFHLLSPGEMAAHTGELRAENLRRSYGSWGALWKS